VIGIIIVHSVLQDGPCFPFFSPAVFSYLWSGSVDAAVQHLNIDALIEKDHLGDRSPEKDCC